jgi:alkylation response protein AidB-like acyl-CoA dehydrogenase
MLRKLDKLGCRASHTGEIVFEDCRVPGDHLLGGEQRLAERIAKGREAEQGSPPPASAAEEGGTENAVQRRSSAALGAFERTRPMVAAQAIGIARAALVSSRVTMPSRARRSANRSSRTRASPSRSPTWRPTSTPPDC